MEPIKKIDTILKLLATNDTLKPAKDTAIFEALLLEYPKLSEQSLQGFELRGILDKLVKDGYVKKDTIQVPLSEYVLYPIDEDRYSITFEGNLFYREGGFSELKKHRVAENTRLGIVERNQKAYQRNQTLLSFLIAAGALVASVYYLIEIWDYFHRSCP